MSRKSLFHFVLVGILWGIPYLLMKVAVEDFPPAAVVAGRTLIGASILIPIAIYRKKFKGAVLGFKFVAFYALLEMIGPWILITTAEQEINSGLTGLLVSTVPIFATIITSLRGDHSVWQFKRIIFGCCSVIKRIFKFIPYSGKFVYFILNDFNDSVFFFYEILFT